MFAPSKQCFRISTGPVITITIGLTSLLRRFIVTNLFILIGMDMDGDNHVSLTEYNRSADCHSDEFQA